MLQQKIGIQLASLRQPFKKALLTAARLGARGVEINGRDEVFSHDFSDTGRRQLRKMLDDLNLRVSAISFQTRRGYNVTEDLERRLAATMRAQRLAHDLHAPVVVNQIGQVPSESSGPQWELMVDSLTELARYGERCGALLAAETGAESGEDLRRLLDAIPGQAIAVDLNPAKLMLNGFSPRDAAEQLGAFVAHFHATDAVRVFGRGQGVEVTLGQGAVGIPELLGVLEHYRYQGFLTVERLTSDHAEREVAYAVRYLQSL